MDLYENINYVDREVEVKHPANDKGTGLFFTLRSPYSPEVEKVQRQIKNERLAAFGGGKKKSGLTAESMEAAQEKIILAAVSDWRWEGDVSIKGEQPAYSPQKLREWVRDRKLVWLKEFLDTELGDHTAFLEDSADS